MYQPAQAPGTVTVCGLVWGSSGPVIPSARTRAIVSAAGVRPGHSAQHSVQEREGRTGTCCVTEGACRRVSEGAIGTIWEG